MINLSYGEMNKNTIAEIAFRELARLTKETAQREREFRRSETARFFY